jgi:hypothetical protein
MQDADSPEWVGKEVKDVYGRRLGRAVGMIFDIGGKVTSLSIEDAGVVTKINPDRITSDGEELVVIPEWMLESRNVGLDRGGLMKRFSALSLMVSEKRISERLSKDIFAKLSAIQKSHEAVLSKTMARLEDLARADAEIDDFVSLVTLQHMAGEMSGESFDFTVRECEKIKAFNGREIIDIRRTLGMATGEQSVANPGDDQSPGAGGRGRPDEEAPPNAENASGDRVLATSYSDARRPDTGRQIPRAVREREDFMIRHENLLEAPIRLVRPEAKSARLSVSPGPDPSLEEPTPPSSSKTHDAAAPAKEEVERSFEMKSDGRPILGQEAAEWVFAKIVDIEALDTMPGDYTPPRSLERKPD